MAEETKILVYAVRIPVLLKYGGQLALVQALLLLPPLGVALAQADMDWAWRYGLLFVGLLVGGYGLSRLPACERIQVNEALTLTLLAFVGSSLLMAWPMTAGGLLWIDAWFEAVSGVTTTGLTTLHPVAQQSPTLLFTRSWMQWYGGLGFIVLSVALLMGHQASARRLSDPTESNEIMYSSARTHARRSLMVYLSLTVLGFVLVWPLVGDMQTTVLHVLSAVSTGGFSSLDNSLRGLESQAATVAVMLVSFLGAVSFLLYWQLAHDWRQGLRQFFNNPELRALLLACLLFGGVLTLLGWWQQSGVTWYHGFMMAVSAQTTTGFETMAPADMDPASRLVMMLSMLIGGSAGSSAGGIKLLRVLILLRLLQLMIRRTAMPQHAVAEPYLGGRKLDADDIIRALQLISLFMGILVLSWIPFVILGYDPLDALFEVVSASGTVGLSSGITRTELEPLLKAVLCFDMLAGRVEVFAMLVLLYPRTWFGQRKEIE